MIALVPALGPDRWDGFAPFGAVHALVICVCAVLMAALAWFGRGLSDKRTELRARRTLALLTLNRWLRATLYFWAVAFATQAFIQPTLTEGPAHVVFWAFWIAHLIIITCAIYDLAVLGFRPGWGDFARASIVGLAWAALALAVDIRLGANYGFIGNPPAFGPWPQRLAIIAALAALAFLLALAPWLVVRRLRGPTSRSDSPPPVADGAPAA